ncbi:hypothetical protein Y032_0339g2966 [Ancylostoma ceylanicum]|uniref:Uncharacterized protein n=1 Tax=Ancylostoma ceylanicum TaxID=53326 RepID=A0A016RYT8_9BILA|nr:hypothetical protein Y032_0339g2966 [Ancylostoma ceylanicum]
MATESILDTATGSSGQKMDRNGCDDLQACACTTPSTSSTEHKTYVDEAPVLSVPRRRSDRIRLVLAYPRTEDSEQMLLLADEPGPSGHLCAGTGELVSLSSSAFTQPDSREELDPFKIRALLDNMKQMVAADSADTSCEYDLYILISKISDKSEIQRPFWGQFMHTTGIIVPSRYKICYYLNHENELGLCFQL